MSSSVATDITIVMDYYLYIATAVCYKIMNIIKIGLTECPLDRLRTYLTGCPPDLTPSHDIYFEVIWKIKTDNRRKLSYYEDVLHNRFMKYRMMREIPRDSEWFNFKEKDGIAIVKEFMKHQNWVECEVPLSEILPVQRKSRHLRNVYYANTYFIESLSERNHILNQIQKPVIESIKLFIQGVTTHAGYIVAPCGIGKTYITCMGIQGTKRVIICCPSNQIQEQWREQLIGASIFTPGQILIMGTNGTTETSEIKEFMKNDTYCIITTYMSSRILVELIVENPPQVIVLDEAHHVAGIVAERDEGEGMTRRLMERACYMKLKRLSLTFTPRFIENPYETNMKYFTMSDETIFGSKIVELKLRDMINKGVLPAYRIWNLRDNTRKGAGIIGKVECICEAWDAKEFKYGEGQYILHHLIIFTHTNEEGRLIEKILVEKLKDTLVLCVKGGDNISSAQEQFSNAKRSILINCKVLGEGLNIPITNAVTFTYSKKSHGEIAQMIFRAGRWYENKSIFHILLPIIDEDDMSGFEEVFMSLASCDENIYDEIMIRNFDKDSGGSSGEYSVNSNGEVSEEIIIDEFDGTNPEEIIKWRENLRRSLLHSNSPKKIQEFCIKQGIDTSIEYLTDLRSQNPDLPEDPKPKNQTWYNWLHPTKNNKITAMEFVTNIIEKNNLKVASGYNEWREVQPIDIREKLPSEQHINDGFFGTHDINFNEILDKYKNQKSHSRR